MSHYTFTDCLTHSMAQLADMDNRSFAESYITVQNTPADMARYCLYDNMDLASSVATFDGDTFVGLALIARRGERGWVAGFGTVPQYRGKGVGKAMLQRTLEVCRADGIKHLQLEVLEQNTAAIRLYESFGFKATRSLVNLQLLTSSIPQHSTNAKISPTSAELIMDWLLQNRQPAWNRERPSLTIGGGTAIVTIRPGGATAAMLYRQRKDTTLVIACALIDRTSTNDFAFMLHHAATGTTTIELHDEPEGSVLYHVCRDLGFSEDYRWHEMHLDILDLKCIILEVCCYTGNSAAGY